MSKNREVDKFAPTQDPTLMFQKKSGLIEFSGVKASILWHCLGKVSLWHYISTQSEGFWRWQKSLTIDDPPTEFPLHKSAINPNHGDMDINSFLGSKEPWPYLTITDYRDAYLRAEISPTDVVQKIIDICKSETIQSYNAVVEIRSGDAIEAAKLSTARYLESHPLSVIDGVPFFVKEHIRIKNYKTYDGLYDDGLESDETATCVKKLVDAGAILIGTTSMPQLGSNTIGFNPKNSSYPKNIWDNKRYAGGSSTGSGIVVGLGLCPFAIGTDSLGSIRVPSGCSGIVGLRSTFSRISTARCSISYNEDAFLTVGPMACCVRDAAIIYLIIAGPDNDYSLGFDQPPLQPPNFDSFEIKSVKFGYYKDYISVTKK